MSAEAHSYGPGSGRSSRASAPLQKVDLFTTDKAYEKIEQALMTSGDSGDIGVGRPGEVGYMPADILQPTTLKW